MLKTEKTNQQTISFKAEAEAFLKAHPDLVKVEMLLPRFCGSLMGKWLPANMLTKLADGAVRLPRSTAALDIWGDDVPAVGIALEKGDPDGGLHASARHPLHGAMGQRAHRASAGDHEGSGDGGRLRL